MMAGGQQSPLPMPRRLPPEIVYEPGTPPPEANYIRVETDNDRMRVTRVHAPGNSHVSFPLRHEGLLVALTDLKLAWGGNPRDLLQLAAGRTFWVSQEQIRPNTGNLLAEPCEFLLIETEN